MVLEFSYPVSQWQTLPSMWELQETQVRSLGREDPWRRAWQPTPVLLPGESVDRGAWRATVHGVTKSWT